ncbi:MAG: hypothetical protein WC346_08460 [Methanogenium sp.]|jgi:hypothetical protein
MKKEIDQRNKEDLLIRCNCGSDHFLSFSFITDKDNFGDEGEKQKKNKGWKDYWIGLIEDYKPSFWFRLKNCYKYLFRHGKAEICYAAIGITSKDMDKIMKHFKKYQAL